MMSISVSVDTSIAGGEQRTAADAARGIFARLLEARTRTAERAVCGYLAAQSDDRLSGLGFSAAEITALRGGVPVNRILGHR